MNNLVEHLRLSLGPSTLNLYLDQASARQIVTAATSEKKDKPKWIEVVDVSGNLVRVKVSEIFVIETIKMTKARKQDPDTIEIKALADCAGVHPVTKSFDFNRV